MCGFSVFHCLPLTFHCLPLTVLPLPFRGRSSVRWGVSPSRWLRLLRAERIWLRCRPPCSSWSSRPEGRRRLRGPRRRTRCEGGWRIYCSPGSVAPLRLSKALQPDWRLGIALLSSLAFFSFLFLLLFWGRRVSSDLEVAAGWGREAGAARAHWAGPAGEGPPQLTGPPGHGEILPPLPRCRMGFDAPLSLPFASA